MVGNKKCFSIVVLIAMLSSVSSFFAYPSVTRTSDAIIIDCIENDFISQFEYWRNLIFVNFHEFSCTVEPNLSKELRGPIFQSLRNGAASQFLQGMAFIVRISRHRYSWVVL